MAAALMAHLDGLPPSWVSLQNKHLTLESLLRLCLWGSLNEGRVPHQSAVVPALSSPGVSSCQAGGCIPGPEHPSWACGSASVSASEGSTCVCFALQPTIEPKDAGWPAEPPVLGPTCARLFAYQRKNGQLLLKALLFNTFSSFVIF